MNCLAECVHQTLYREYVGQNLKIGMYSIMYLRMRFRYLPFFLWAQNMDEEWNQIFSRVFCTFARRKKSAKWPLQQQKLLIISVQEIGSTENLRDMSRIFSKRWFLLLTVRKLSTILFRLTNPVKSTYQGTPSNAGDNLWVSTFHARRSARTKTKDGGKVNFIETIYTCAFFNFSWTIKNTKITKRMGQISSLKWSTGMQKNSSYLRMRRTLSSIQH